MVQVFCDECSQPHSARIVIERDELFSPDQSVADIYDGQELPVEIVNMQSNYFQCPNTGKMFTQRNNHQVFLVRLPESS
jgi:protein-arginine kinase activator protein McsA